MGLNCDVRVSSQVNPLVQSAVDKFGSETIDILVNNAGVAFDKKLVDIWRLALMECYTFLL
ncbi:MAG: SDR family NAD(P)-dependent oxidoreductase [Nitrososphaeraceae archaeon]